MNASPGTLVSCDNILGEFGPGDDPVDEDVDNRDLGGGAVTVGRDDAELERWRSRAWVSDWNAAGCGKKDEWEEGHLRH